MIAEDLKLRMAGLSGGLHATSAVPETVKESAQMRFTDFATWFNKLGRDAIREEAKRVTVIDPDVEWTVDPGAFLSKGRNTPFGEWQLKGKARMTIIKNGVVWEEG